MIRFRFVAMVITCAVAAGSAAGADKKAATEPVHCERLITEMQTAIDGLVAGEFSHRLAVALAAHERLGCDPAALLDVLRIKRPKTEPAPRK